MRGSAGGQAGFAGGLLCGGRGAYGIERSVRFATRSAGNREDYSRAEIADVAVRGDFGGDESVEGTCAEDRGDRGGAEAGFELPAGTGEIFTAGERRVCLRRDQRGVCGGRGRSGGRGGPGGGGKSHSQHEEFRAAGRVVQADSEHFGEIGGRERPGARHGERGAVVGAGREGFARGGATHRGIG